jgi:hypothetical protein
LLHEIKRRGRDEKRRHSTALREFSEENVARRPNGVDDWQRLFGVIFAASLRHLELPDIALHLLEEMGEVSDALARMYTYTEDNFVRGEPLMRQIRLEEELADVTSWLFAAVEKLDYVRRRADEYEKWLILDGFEREPLLLSKIIWRRYGSDELEKFICWKCREPICTCHVILAPPDRSVEQVCQLIGAEEERNIESGFNFRER